MKQILLILFAYAFSQPALADICYTTFEKDTVNADVIFVGKLIKIDHSIYWLDGYPRSIYTFEILESFKGLSKYRNVTSIMSPVDGCCSPHFKQDSTFLIFAFSVGDYPNVYWTNDCTLSGLLSKTKEFYYRLGESLKPHGGADDLELFNEQKKLIVGEELKKMDSINLLHSNLESALTSERQKNSNLTIGLIILGLITCFLIFFCVRKKPPR